MRKRLGFIFGGLLFFQSLLIVSGGAVRLTGSGLGCPTWPTCTGNSYKPIPHQAQGQLHAWIEFGNRLIAWLIFIFALAALIGVRKLLRDRSNYRTLFWLAIGQLLGFLAQAILGGITVLTKLNPFSVSAHFLLSLPLVAGALSLLIRYREKPIFKLYPNSNHLFRALLSTTTLLIIVGTIVTGSGPLAGDIQAKRYKLYAAKIAHLHSYIAIAVLILAVGLLAQLRNTLNITLTKALWTFIFVLFLQGALGYWQFNQGLPELLVGIHLLGATLTWNLIWYIKLKIRSRE